MDTEASIRPRASALERALPYVLAYAAAVFLGRVVLSPLGLSAIWPANAILVAALLLLDRPSAPYCLTLCALANILTAMMLGSDALRIGFLTGLNLVECLAVAGLTRAVCGPNLNFSDGRRLFAFIAGAAVPACLATAVLLVGMIGPLHITLAPDAGKMWFVSHTLGAVMVVPALTAIANRRRFAAVTRPARELLAAMVLLGALTFVLFWWQAQASILFLIFPAMMLIAFRYGPVGAATGSLLIAAVAGLFVGGGLEHLALGGAKLLQAKVQWLQFFIAVVFLTTLPAAGAVASYARMRTLLARRTVTARQARHRADCASAAKGEFLANMSHEIRTPLNGVIGLADALSRTELTPPQRDMLKMILGSGKALTGLLSDALDLARADSGALELVDEAFDVREAVGSAAYLFESIASEKGLDFQVAFDLDGSGAVVGDALRIRQIISNLISNAVKFTDTGSVTVAVSLKAADQDAQTLAVVVRDTGHGFGEGVKARLFNRFEQGDSSVTRRFGGSGLGLSIAHRLSQMMGAEIACESEPGAGSTFSFTVVLPGAPAVHAPELEPLSAPTPVAAGRMSVLLAEDHPVNRKVIQAMLGDSVDLTMASDGAAAVDAFETQAFDVILMDTHMPVMDGLSAIRAIRALERDRALAPTPIVSLTADAMPQQVEAATAAGADLHLSKPITGDGLYGVLQACMGLRAAAPLRAAG